MKKVKNKTARLPYVENIFKTDGGQVNLRQSSDLNSGYTVVTEEILRPMERGQITLPAKIRKNLGINAKTWLKVTELSNRKITIEAVDVSENKNSNIIPAQMPIEEMLKELDKLPKPDWKDDHFDYIKKMRKSSHLKLKKMLKKYDW